MIGQTLGHYRIETQLGAGGMGVVYRARDTRLERSVALKLVSEKLSTDAGARGRLLREARAASGLNHPHICIIHEVAEADGHIFIVMEHVEGQPLRDLIPHDGLPVDTVVRYGIQIADALAHAHQRGIIHRDLKAANIMVTPEGRIKILDFGLSRRLPREDLAERSTRSESSMAEAGQVVGTLHALAPEVLRGQTAAATADIWALGILLHHMASGSLPFTGRTKFEVTAAILGQPPTPLPERVPPVLRAVIMRCLAKDPGERYRQAIEVRATMEVLPSGSASTPALPVLRAPPRGKAVWAGVGLAVALAALAVIPFLPGRSRVESVAVLPFVGSDAQTEYLTDGIAESVIGRLSELPTLRVIAFSSVLRYKGRAADPQSVVRELRVGAVLVGRVVREADGLAINVELVSADDGRRLWGNHYRVRGAEVLTVQQDIAQRIAERLGVPLGGLADPRVGSRQARNTAAYEAYLRGRYYWNKFTAESYEKSLDYYQQAIEKDSTYALAYAGLAQTYLAMAWEERIPPREALDKAEAAARKGVELDAELGEPYVAVAWVKFAKYKDWTGGEADLHRAIELSPGSASAVWFTSLFMRATCRWNEAIELMRRDLELDPLSVKTNRSAGATYYGAGRYDEAIEQYRKTLQIEPDSADVHDDLADVYARKGMYQEALEAKRRALVLYGDGEAAAALGSDASASGYRTAVRALAQRQIEAYRQRAQQEWVSPMAFALLYSFLEDRDHAFEWLDKAEAQGSPWLTFLASDPMFEPLRSDPRYGELVRRLRIPVS